MNQLELSEATEQAEEALIGAILIQSTGGFRHVIDEVAPILQPWDFRGCTRTDRPDRWIWRARVFYAMLQCELAPHIINVSHKLFELNMLEVMDCSLMMSCAANVPCSLDYMDYARAVKDYSIKRQAKYYANKGDLEKLGQVLDRPKYY
jgi:hypothetical protein